MPTSFLSIEFSTVPLVVASLSLLDIKGTFSPTIISASSLSDVSICGVERTFTEFLKSFRLKSAANPGTVIFSVVTDPLELTVVIGTSINWPIPPAEKPERPVRIDTIEAVLIFPNPPIATGLP